MNYCLICHALIRRTELLCRKHWFQVPKGLRDRIWKLYREQRGSVAHRRAILEAIAGIVA